MNHNDQQQQQYPTPQSYPPTMEGYAQGPYVMPPPVGYPAMKADAAAAQQHPQQGGASETTSRGDEGDGGHGFWKGCCAAICCCCVLDMCF